MHPTIYIAGSSRDIPRARRAMDAARELGFVLTCDWPLAIERAGGRANEGLHPDAALLAATDCLDGAIVADVFWALLDPEHRSPGMHAELGARVYARGRAGLILSGPGPQASIYYAGAVHVPTDEEAAPYLLGHVMTRRSA